MSSLHNLTNNGKSRFSTTTNNAKLYNINYAYSKDGMTYIIKSDSYEDINIALKLNLDRRRNNEDGIYDMTDVRITSDKNILLDDSNTKMIEYRGKFFVITSYYDYNESADMYNYRAERLNRYNERLVISKLSDIVDNEISNCGSLVQAIDENMHCSDSMPVQTDEKYAVYTVTSTYLYRGNRNATDKVTIRMFNYTTKEATELMYKLQNADKFGYMGMPNMQQVSHKNQGQIRSNIKEIKIDLNYNMTDVYDDYFDRYIKKSAIDIKNIQ